MELGLKGRVAIVCGASQGMGQAIALGLSREGAQVLLVARNAESLAKAEAAILQEYPEAKLASLAVDLTQPDSAEVVVKAAYARWDRLDVLVTNTGGPPPGQPLDLADEQYLLAYQQNFMNVVRLCRHAVPVMRVHGYGRIINMLALSVRQIEDNLVLSSTSRLGVVAYARYLAEQVAAEGITVNNVLPGSIHTERLAQVAHMQAQHFGRDPAAELEVRAERVPMKRLGQPQEMADLVAFLASERAGFLTGLSIPVEGGQLRSVL
ncbi:MAG: SDR family oxidoreductase [Rugosibacter sp.]|jgi:3-oxoacyl-[acyl-carrier protein] reductase|nr:SDR family oxidoreductase [Rugosibacter sp.]